MLPLLLFLSTVAAAAACASGHKPRDPPETTTAKFIPSSPATCYDPYQVSQRHWKDDIVDPWYFLARHDPSGPTSPVTAHADFQANFGDENEKNLTIPEFNRFLVVVLSDRTQFAERKLDQAIFDNLYYRGNWIHIDQIFFVSGAKETVDDANAEINKGLKIVMNCYHGPYSAAVRLLLAMKFVHKMYSDEFYPAHRPGHVLFVHHDTVADVQSLAEVITRYRYWEDLKKPVVFGAFQKDDARAPSGPLDLQDMHDYHRGPVAPLKLDSVFQTSGPGDKLGAADFMTSYCNLLNLAKTGFSELQTAIKMDSLGDDEHEAEIKALDLATNWEGTQRVPWVAFTNYSYLSDFESAELVAPEMPVSSPVDFALKKRLNRYLVDQVQVQPPLIRRATLSLAVQVLKLKIDTARSNETLLASFLDENRGHRDRRDFFNADPTLYNKDLHEFFFGDGIGKEFGGINQVTCDWRARLRKFLSVVNQPPTTASRLRFMENKCQRAGLIE